MRYLTALVLALTLTVVGYNTVTNLKQTVQMKNLQTQLMAEECYTDQECYDLTGINY